MIEKLQFFLRDLAPNPALPAERHDVSENVKIDGYSQNETSNDVQTNVEISVDGPRCDSDAAENTDHNYICMKVLLVYLIPLLYVDRHECGVLLNAMVILYHTDML